MIKNKFFIAFIVFISLFICRELLSREAKIFLAEKQGKVFRWNALYARWDDLPLKSRIMEGNIIKTGETKSQAVIAFGQKAVLTISEDTIVRVTAALFEEEDIKSLKIQVPRGKVWSAVEKLPVSDRKVEIETPNTLAGVRGTVFAVEFSPRDKATEVGVVDGEVKVGSRLASGSVLLRANMSTVVIANKPPVSPRALEEKEKREWQQWKESIPFSDIGIVGGIAEVNAIQVQEASRIVRELGMAKKGTEKVKEDFKHIKSALLLFCNDTKTVPGKLDDLIENPGIPNWKGPYLGAGTTFRDPYGRPYQYRKKKTPGGKEYIEISTFGLVGAAGETYGQEKEIIFIDKLREELNRLRQDL